MTTLAVLLLAAAASSGHFASGQVVAPNGSPVAGAEVCAFDTAGLKLGCVTTDAKGYYRMDNPAVPNLLVQAAGYKAMAVLAAPVNEPVVLRPAVGLKVTVVDVATGHPISKGTVAFHLPSGKSIGSAVPFNRAGVKLSNMSEGETLIVATADGYESGDPVVVQLKSGVENAVVVKLKKSAKAPAKK
ncbi:MAG TPA: carboxypeptidase-like regulatory domain-containing protein [Candidatus Polarisedimenticolaceae bacterium]|nr:carboxypeptidase-like regulatory domain-containing protein [Candidatus Polarisedimenticolaceae bacterium]